jgi:hypothetical protein
MQTYALGIPIMQRDMDLIRTLMLKLEADNRLIGAELIQFSPQDLGLDDSRRDEIIYHLGLLIGAGFLRGVRYDAHLMPTVSEITWDGQEFLANIKDENIWARTKEKAKEIPGISLKIIAEIAESLIRAHFHLP